MRRFSGAVVAMIFAISFYFALFWGFDAPRIFTSPTYGIEDVWRSQIIFGIGRYLGLGPTGLLQLAAFYGAIKLTVAAVCAIHIVDRCRSLIYGKANAEILEAALLLVVIASIAAVGPALWMDNTDVVREHTINLLLAGVAAALCIIERFNTEPRDAGEAATAAELTTEPAVQRSAWYSPWR